MFAALVGEAESFQVEHQWEAAAGAWERAALMAVKRGATGPASQCADAAGECWRKSDRPKRAEQAFQLALDTGGQELSRIRLAAVLGDLGEVDRARELLTLCLQDHTELEALAVDTMVTLVHGYGAPEELGPWVDRLEKAPNAGWSSVFRRGQQHRLAGRFEQATGCFTRIVDAYPGSDGAMARAAAEGELGEVALLQGLGDCAIDLFSSALAGHAGARRRSLQIRGELARARAMVEAGASVLPNLLEQALTFAHERGLQPLVCDVRITLGMVLAERSQGAARGHFDEAIGLAQALGSRRRAGRARYERAIRTPDPDVLAQLLLAEAELVDSVPRAARARLARASVLVELGHPEGLELAAGLVARFQAIGMQQDALLATELLRRRGPLG